MTVQEFYQVINGDYEAALSRLMKDERIVKYLKRFKDSQELTDLISGLEEERYEDAFRAVHNLKGVSLNLSLDPLAHVSSVLCEELRNGKPQIDISGMLEDVKKVHEEVLKAIDLLDS